MQLEVLRSITLSQSETVAWCHVDTCCSSSTFKGRFRFTV